MHTLTSFTSLYYIYAAVVIAVTAVAFVLVEGDNLRIAHVLRDVVFLLAQAQELVEIPQ